MIFSLQLLSQRGRSSGFAGTHLQPPAKRYKGDQAKLSKKIRHGYAAGINMIQIVIKF